MLIGKGTVGATPDSNLDDLVSTPNGQACFERNNGQIIYCLRWGTITNPVGSISTSGPSPGDGQSLEPAPPAARSGRRHPRPRTGAAVAAAAAGPAAAGRAGVAAPARTGGTTDTTRPLATLTTAGQKLGRVISSGYKLRVRSNETGKARAQLLRRGKVLRTSTRSLSAGVARSFTLTLPRATKLALARSRSATFTLKVRVTDAAGNVRNITRTLTLRR